MQKLNVLQRRAVQYVAYYIKVKKTLTDKNLIYYFSTPNPDLSSVWLKMLSSLMYSFVWQSQRLFHRFDPIFQAKVKSKHYIHILIFLFNIQSRAKLFFGIFH